MAAKKKALGKGLDALLGPRSSVDLAGLNESEQLRFLPVDLLQRSPYQPRSDFNQEALQELTDSIKAQCVLQPILVRSVGKKGMFEIIAGERRWRAAQAAGLHEVPTVVHQIDDKTAVCMALIENIQRQDLNPLEEAHALSRLLDEFAMTHEEVADAVGRSRSTVSNLLRMLELDDKVKKMLESGQLDMGHARALLTLPDKQQFELSQRIVRQDLSVRATEAAVSKLQSGKNKPKKHDIDRDPNIRRLETDLSERFGTVVKVKHTKKGKGSLEIHYNSLEELEGILSKIQ